MFFLKILPVMTICFFLDFPNVAFHKPVWQSSISGSFPWPSKAVDGNPYSCIHTQTEHAPWWKVDLQYDHVITAVTILNSQKAGTSVLNNFKV